jgi:hypothetical protein
LISSKDCDIVAAMSVRFDWPAFLPAFREAAQSAGFSESQLSSTDAGPLSVWTRHQDGPRVYISAGIHGDEPAGPMALLQLMRAGFFADEIHWTLCPALNPNGLSMQQRENADGIDLNRDYWKRQTAEVRAHTDWLSQQPAPDRFLSLHEDWETRGFYLYEINLGDDQPSRIQKILNAVDPWFHAEDADLIDDHLPRGPGWIYHGSDPDIPTGWPEAIFLAKHGCPLSFTFETPSQAALENRVAAHCAAVKAACEFLID